MLLKATLPLLCLALLLPATSLCPILDSTRAPYFSLDSDFSAAVLRLSDTGGRIGAPIPGLSLILLLSLLRRRDISPRRGRDTTVSLLILVLFAAGGAWLNEHVIKRYFGIPRPNIEWLCGPDGKGSLKMTATDFYIPETKAERRIPLQQLLNGKAVPVPLTERIRDHWILEVGYSFPSGHAFLAFFFATYFPALAVSWLPERHWWPFYLLMPWAVLIAMTRLVLRVHTPMDISAGALQGMCAGLLAFLIVRGLCRSGPIKD